MSSNLPKVQVTLDMLRSFNKNNPMSSFAPPSLPTIKSEVSIDEASWPMHVGDFLNFRYGPQKAHDVLHTKHMCRPNIQSISKAFDPTLTPSFSSCRSVTLIELLRNIQDKLTYLGAETAKLATVGPHIAVMFHSGEQFNVAALVEIEELLEYATIGKRVKQEEEEAKLRKMYLSAEHKPAASVQKPRKTVGEIIEEMNKDGTT